MIRRRRTPGSGSGNPRALDTSTKRVGWWHRIVSTAPVPIPCPACRFENSAGAKFCGACGTALALGCPRCGTQNPPAFRFCSECGSPLGGTAEPTSAEGTVTTPAATGSSAPKDTVFRLQEAKVRAYTPSHLAEKILRSAAALEGERKAVTVLFADVAGFTALASRISPEDLHAIMDGCFERLSGTVHRYEGTINQFTGDGVMALFGAPIAHEDHAERAVHAALAIQTAMASYGATLEREHGIEFRMRIGLNSGTVVVGKIGDNLRMDYTAQGGHREPGSPPRGSMPARRRPRQRVNAANGRRSVHFPRASSSSQPTTGPYVPVRDLLDLLRSIRSE